MEPVAKQVIVTFSWVEKLEEKFQKKWVSGHGQDAVFERMSLGWFMLLKGSHEAIYVGDVEPNFGPGHPIKITFERA